MRSRRRAHKFADERGTEAETTDMTMKSFAAALLLAACCASAALAQNAGSTYVSTVFKDGPNGEKIHIASEFVCPDKIGRYIRDAVGEGDLETGTDFCSYYALDGIYGTVSLTPLQGQYNPASSLTSEFVQQEGIGAKKVDEKPLDLGPAGNMIKVYTRTYETAHLATLHYRITFTGAAVKHWIVETTVEYADPRDDDVEMDFLNAVYDAALKQIGAGTQPAK